jgi:branched-chain amino acid transport system ATP-binding protein
VTQTLLQVQDASVYYGRARALSCVSLEVKRGECLAVLGANGAGKTTLARAISGLVPLRRGQIRFAGRPIAGLATHKIARLGILHVRAEKLIFPGLSVVDNLRMSIRHADVDGSPAEAMERMLTIFPVLASRRKQPAGTLSGGEQQMLSLARVLVVPPELLIVDELSHGLAPIIVEQVFETLRLSLTLGVTMIVIEQFVTAALGLADHAAILRRGELVWSGQANQAGERLVEHYLD